MAASGRGWCNTRLWQCSEVGTEGEPSAVSIGLPASEGGGLAVKIGVTRLRQSPGVGAEVGIVLTCTCWRESELEKVV